MSGVDNLPGDQRAVLQLVLGRGRSYDEIARLLSINPDAVRERALTALDTLGPQTRVEQATRAQICDYLLGQLPAADIEPIRDRLAQAAAERAWARVVSSELAPLASGPLPDIPLETSAARAAQQPAAPEPEPPPAPSFPAAEPAAPEAVDGAAPGPPRTKPPRQSVLRRRRKPKPPGAPKPARVRRTREPKPPREPRRSRETTAAGDPGPGPRSSRLGGLILIGVATAVVIVALIVVLGSGGSTKKAAAVASTPATAAATTTTATSAAATTTTGTSTAAKVVAQINLTPSVAGSKTAGIAEVLREGTTNGIAIVAQNVPANTKNPPNAYAVWLYNSPTDAKILGFVNPGVSKTGKLSTAGGLPTNAAHYKQLIVTVETSANPKTPGTIILKGALTGV